MHRKCWAQVASAITPSSVSSLPAQDDLGAPDLELLLTLPSIHEICERPVLTRMFLEPELLGKVEKAFLRCVSNAALHSDKDAWAFIGTEGDTAARRRSRVAWTELFMFCKTCIPALPGGKAKARRNLEIILNRFARWNAGERRTLWDDAPLEKHTSNNKPSSQTKEEERRQQTCIALAQQGMPGKAIDRLMGSMLAPDNLETEQMMKSKFVSPPQRQSTSRRPPAPVANELSEACVARAILSFQRGLGGGPSGARPDLFRQIIGDEGTKPGIVLITQLCNVRANGSAPEHLRPYLGGANGFASAKDPKAKAAEHAEVSANGPLRDARPVCSGEVWRRIVGKALLATESENLASHLFPHQLAVKVPAGAEILPHLARQWFLQHDLDEHRVLVDFDESNAHNQVDRHTFLLRAHEIAPGICRWLEYIHPTSEATFVFYRGRVIESRAGGQQGCPLIGACHALCQRIVLESLGVAPVDPRTTPIAEVLSPAPQLDMTPGFADDGFLAGPSGEVLRCLQHLQTVMPSLGLSFSRLEAVPSAGMRCSFDTQSFINLGCTLNLNKCVSVMKSPIGDRAFCEEEIGKRVAKASATLRALSGLPDEHVALYLLRFQCGRIDYTIRTTPADSCLGALAEFDVEVRRAYEKIIGKSVSDAQWTQASSPVRHGGPGLRSTVATADAAYYASRAVTWERCEAIYPRFSNLIDDPVRTTEIRINSEVGEEAAKVPALPAESDIPPQQKISKALAVSKAKRLQTEAGSFDRARLLAYSAPMSGRWLSGAASLALDKHMSTGELITTTALRLGADVDIGGTSCKFCGAVLDSKGIHSSSCMAGGDAVLRHNSVRNIVFNFCRRANLRPELEKAGVLDEPGVLVDMRRPADVMVESMPAPGGLGVERVAFDVKIINSLGASHFDCTLTGPVAAASAYREHSANHQNTRVRCAARGVRYEPLVFTTQGGCESHAEAFLSSIAELVAKSEFKDTRTIKSELLEAISLSIARSVARAIFRRRKTYEFTFNLAQGRIASELFLASFFVCVWSV